MLKKYFKKVRFQKKKNIILFALGSRLDLHKVQILHDYGMT